MDTKKLRDYQARIVKKVSIDIYICGIIKEKNIGKYSSVNVELFY